MGGIGARIDCVQHGSPELNTFLYAIPVAWPFCVEMVIKAKDYLS